MLVSNLGEVAKVNPETGEVVDTKDINATTVISPVVANEKIYILSEKGRLLSLR